MTAKKIVIEEKDDERIGLTAYKALVAAKMPDVATELAMELISGGNVRGTIGKFVMVKVKAPPPNPKPKFKAGDVVKDGKEIGVISAVDWGSGWDADDCVYTIFWLVDNGAYDVQISEIDTSAKLICNVKELAKKQTK